MNDKYFKELELFCNSHRFNFLFTDNYISKYFRTHFKKNIIDQRSPLMIFVGPTFNIYWEFRDGIMDAAPSESCVILYQLLEQFGNKRFFYVKPNFSLKKCKDIIGLAQENNGTVLTCPKWSYMNMYQFYNQRHELRKYNTFSTKKNDICFVGGFRKYMRVKSRHTDERYRYPIYPSQLKFLKHPSPQANAEDTYIDYPQREDLIEKLEKYYPVNIFHDKSARDCLQIYLDSKLQFQPHGVGPRHSIYECMMLGIPSLIPECSYLDEIVRKYNIICSEFMDDIPINKIEKVLQDETHFEYVKNGIIELYEEHMTPQAILDDVFDQIKKNIS